MISENRNNTEPEEYNGGTQSKAKPVLAIGITEIMQMNHTKIQSEMLFVKCRGGGEVVGSEKDRDVTVLSQPKNKNSMHQVAL